ncbi:MAG: hypothetical protein LUI87_00960, partial [Lachnospiraceae bacterium]|nr:hypothetical protein [Lachnospiraceae bacterium]
EIKEKEAWPPQDIFAGKNQEKTAAKEKSTDKAASATKITADKEGTHWQPVRLPGSLADAGLENFCGSVMLRKKFSVPDERAGKKALLRLGTLADADRAYINGVLVGETGYRYPPRRYTVPEGVLQAGENELLIHLVCRNGDGRMTKGKPVEVVWEDVCDDSWLLKHRRPESEASIAARPDIVQREELFSCEESPAPISLEGEWEYLALAATEPAPEQVFLNRGATGLFHEMVAPALAYTVKGVVWYQGESNDCRPEEYEKLLPAMISNWQRRWMQERLPFVIVQLPNCDIDIAKETEDGELPWPMIREAQRQAGKLPDVAVTVNLDIGEDNDLHPLNKKEAARRAALALRKIVYHEDVVCSGPKLCGWEKHTDGLVLHFDRTVVCRTVQNSKRAEDVLANAAVKESAEKTCVPDGLFELYCENPGWMPAKARLYGQEIRLQPVLPADTESAACADSSSHSAHTESAACADPSSHSADTDSFMEKSVLAVRYAWSNAPGSRLLYGEEGLCVAPFCEWLRCEDKCDR